MANFPLTVHHDDARRIARANALILTRQVKLGVYDVQDALLVRQNERRRQIGAEDVADAIVARITIGYVYTVTLLQLNLSDVKAAGHKTQRDFFDVWLKRYSTIEPDTVVNVCRFEHAEPAPRFLTAKPPYGITTRRDKAARGEPECVPSMELADLATANTRRYEETHNEDLRRRRAQSIAQLAKDAARRGDASQARALHGEINRLIELIEGAA